MPVRTIKYSGCRFVSRELAGFETNFDLAGRMPRPKFFERFRLTIFDTGLSGGWWDGRIRKDRRGGPWSGEGSWGVLRFQERPQQLDGLREFEVADVHGEVDRVEVRVAVEAAVLPDTQLLAPGVTRHPTSGVTVLPDTQLLATGVTRCPTSSSSQLLTSVACRRRSLGTTRCEVPAACTFGHPGANSHAV
jgi:hypothetical protein